VAQIALCCVTVTAAFVSLRGLGKALTMDLGFNPKNAVRAQFDLSHKTGDAHRLSQKRRASAVFHFFQLFCENR
jgi:hypothetical protein